MKTRFILAILTSLMLTATLISCDSFAEKVMKETSDVSIEKLAKIDSLIAQHGDPSMCLRGQSEAVPMVSIYGPNDTTLAKIYEILTPLNEEYEEKWKDSVPDEELTLPTLLWLNNRILDYHAGFVLFDKNQMYCRAWPTDFKFSHLKDSLKLAAFDEKHNVADKRVFKNAIYDVKKAKYITFIDPICELSPNSGLGSSFNSGGILANANVYDIETGELVKSLSVFAFNSSYIEYESHTGFDLGPSTSLLNKDLIGNFHRVLKLKLNEVAEGTSSTTGSAGAALQ